MRVRVVVLIVFCVEHAGNEALDVVVGLAHRNTCRFERAVQHDQAQQRHGNERGKTSSEQTTGEGTDRAASDPAVFPCRRVAGKHVDEAKHRHCDDAEAQSGACANLVARAHVKHERNSDADEHDRQDQRTRTDQPVRAGGDQIPDRARNIEPHRATNDRGQADEHKAPSVGVVLEGAGTRRGVVVTLLELVVVVVLVASRATA